jgi:hypothetical protein
MPKSAPRKTSSRKTKPTRTRPLTKKSVKPIMKTKLPGVMALSKLAFATMLRQDKLILRLAALAWAVALLVTGMSYATYYGDLSQSTDDVSGNLADGFLKKSVEVTALSISLLSGGAHGLLTESQQLYAFVGYLLLWLVLVWLLRHTWNDKNVTLRDGLYNAAAPLLPTVALVAVACLQLVPLALLISLFATVAVNGVFTGLWWTLAFFIVTLFAAAATLYWLVGTLMSLMVVTISGTYPVAALRSAKVLVRGYRRQLLTRIAWLLLVVLLVQIVLVVPLVILDVLTGYKLSWLVVVTYQFAVVFSYIVAGTYIYTLYRRLIDERS